MTSTEAELKLQRMSVSSMQPLSKPIMTIQDLVDLFLGRGPCSTQLKHA